MPYLSIAAAAGGSQKCKGQKLRDIASELGLSVDFTRALLEREIIPSQRQGRDRKGMWYVRDCDLQKALRIIQRAGFYFNRPKHFSDLLEAFIEMYPAHRPATLREEVPP